MQKKIKLFSPFIGKEEEKALNITLRSGSWASGAGLDNVNKFEKNFKNYVRADDCIAVNTGTAALHLALSLIGIKNKEVIVPSLSFISTAHAVVYNGGKPIFVDVEPDTLCLDPTKVKKAITKRTKVILPVHFAGIPCNLDEILELCKNHGIDLVEDAAHAAGALYKNKRVGSHGTAVCFSFHPVKNLAMPTGGAITLNGGRSKKFAEILKSLRWCGISNRIGAKYDVSRLGLNYYMNEFSAAIGLEQLKKLNRLNSIRKKIAKRYFKELNIDEKMPFNNDYVYHIYWIKIKNRNRFMKYMNNNGVETGIHYLPIHKMSFYSKKAYLPITEETSKNIVSIPMHPGLKEAEVSKVIKLINRF